MSTSKIFLLSAFVVLFTASCSHDIFITHNGNMPSNERIDQIRIGQSREQVQNILGAPSSVVSLDRNTWIYMSSDIERIAFFSPKEVSRDVLTVRFNDAGKVTDIERLSEKDGKKVAFSSDKTETYGHTPGFFQKYFGGVGQYMPFPTNTNPNQ